MGSLNAWEVVSLCCPISVFHTDFPKPRGPAPGVGIYLGHFLAVGLGVQGCLGEQGWMLFRGNTKLIVEGMVPDLGVKQGEAQ